MLFVIGISNGILRRAYQFVTCTPSPPQGFDILSPWYKFLWVKHRHQFITSKKRNRQFITIFPRIRKDVRPSSNPLSLWWVGEAKLYNPSSSCWSERPKLNDTSSSFGQSEIYLLNLSDVPVTLIASWTRKQRKCNNVTRSSCACVWEIPSR
jgi:hypothetical protein